MFKVSRRRGRGFSLIEAMISLAVLTVGLLGAMQATVIVSNTNSGASKMSRAVAIAAQVRAGLEARRLEGLLADGFFDTCEAAALNDHAGGLAGLAAPYSTECIVDLDAYEEAADPQLVPGYSTEDAQLFRRVVVRIFDQRELLAPDLTPVVQMFGVVVSWRDGSRLMTHRQFVSLYNRVAISASVEL